MVTTKTSAVVACVVFAAVLAVVAAGTKSCCYRNNLDNSIQANVCTTSFNCPFITDFSTQGQPGSSCAQCGGGGFDDPFIPDDGEAEPRRGGLGAGGFGSTMCCLYHKNDNPESISKSNYNTTTTDQANCPPPLYGWSQVSHWMVDSSWDCCINSGNNCS